MAAARTTARSHRRRRRHLRALALAPALAVVVATLTGCVPEPWLDSAGTTASPRPTRDPGSVPPKPGTCWTVDDSNDPAGWSWWQGDTRVSCLDEHLLMTAAVVQLDDDAAFHEGRFDAGELEQNALDAACEEAIGTTEALRDGSRVRVFWFLPSPEAWKGGARWLRCDVGALDVGPLDGAVLEPLPTHLSDVTDELFDTYLMCLDTPYPAEETGPLTDLAAASVARCEGAQWEFGAPVEFDSDVYPGAAVIQQGADAACALELASHPGRSIWAWNAPSPEAWLTGSRTVSCWVA